ncbi:MAG TPA: hypothetical protein VF626_01090, partial [Chthoniobacterales bacterium]
MTIPKNPITAVYRSTILALTLLGFVVSFHARAEEAPATPAATAKPDRAQLETQFKQAEADRAAAKEKTKERADAAAKAMQIASDIAWLAFDAGKFDEAATWFATSAKLKAESYVNARGYWEEYEKTAAAELDGKIDGQIKELEKQLATAEESNREILRKLIHGWEKNRHLNRYNTVTMLQQLARDNNDAENLLKYYQQELDIRQAEMAYLKKANAPQKELDEKTAQLATALERVASGQADLAQFEKAEKNGLEALALRRGLPEEMPERKLEESLNSLGRMYAFNIGDLGKARGYYE